MNFIHDAGVEKQLYPFTLTRPVEDIRIGILTIREKWSASGMADSSIAVPSNLVPSAGIIAAIRAGTDFSQLHNAFYLLHPWHIFQYNNQSIRHDVEIITAGRTSAPISSSNKITAVENIFMEEGAVAEHCSLNAAAGPIYIGKNAEVMEGSMLRGPVALCEGAVVKMGTRIYGATTIGPYSVAGGEIKNAVITGYSNKAHDGYLGDAVIGEWCNLGAGTTCSNLKNNAGNIGIWNPYNAVFTAAGTKCGLLMGDYSRSAINTSFNTGTVTGVCCNIFGNGLTPRHIASFSWGADGSAKYDFEKAIRDTGNWKQLKNQPLTQAEIIRLKQIFDNN